MAFKRLTECDKSDMSAWASQPACKEFAKELHELRKTELARLIKEPSDKNASAVRTYDKVLALIEECLK